MLAQNKSVYFLVDCSLKLGLGHFMRCLNLSRHLSPYNISSRFCFNTHVDVDLSSYSISVVDSIPNNSIIIVDCLTISERFLNSVSLSSKSILVSPVHNTRNVFFDYIFSKNWELIKTNFDHYISKVNYSFASCANFIKRKLSFSDGINVGICLGGGAPLSSLENSLITHLSQLSLVSSLYLISRSSSLISGNINNKPIYISDFNPQPWEFFSKINFFIGSDGLMLSESIAQSIPTYFFRRFSTNKNSRLTHLSICSQFLSFSDFCNLTGNNLDFRPQLLSLHQNAYRFDAPSRALALVNDIVNILI